MGQEGLGGGVEGMMGEVGEVVGGTGTGFHFHSNLLHCVET